MRHGLRSVLSGLLSKRGVRVGSLRDAGWPLALPVIAILVAHWPELSGWLSSDPMLWAAHINPRYPQTVLPGLPGWNDPNTGVTTQALGGLAARDWLHGVVPWWNPYSGVGLPLAAEMQNSAMFLPFVLLLALPHGLLPLKIALQIVAAFATLALLRQLDARRSVATIGAICFALNGTFAWMGHGPIMPVAFLPLLLLGIERTAARLDAGLGGISPWLPIGLAYSIASGFPETAYLDGLFAACWTLCRAGRIEGVARRHFIGRTALGAGIGLLLSMPALLPFLHMLRQSSLGYHDTEPPFVMPSIELSLFLTPYLYGPISYAGQWMEAGFTGGFRQLGLIPLALASFSKAGRWNALRLMIAAWFVLWMVQACGVPVLALVPFIGKVLVFRYIWPSWEFGLVVLASLAIEDWLSGRLPSPTACLAGWAGLILALAAAWFGRAHIRLLLDLGTGYQFYLFGSALWACTVLFSVTILVASARYRIVMLGTVLSVEAIALSSFTLLSGARHETLDLPAIRFLQTNIGLSRFATSGPITPNYGAYFGLASLNADYLPMPKSWLDYSADHLRENDTHPADSAAATRRKLAEYEALGVAFMIVDHGAASLPTARSSARLIYADPVLDIYRLEAPTPYFSTIQGQCTLRVRTRLEVQADCDQPSRLLRLELSYPGWSASVDGNASTLDREREIFQSIALPRGRSLVRFRYAPPGAAFAVLAMVVGLLALCRTAISRPRRRSGPV